MNIILLERVGNLGDLGEEVNVKNGFARNFLIPNVSIPITLSIPPTLVRMSAYLLSTNQSM